MSFYWLKKGKNLIGFRKENERWFKEIRTRSSWFWSNYGGEKIKLNGWFKKEIWMIISTNGFGIK